MNTQFFRRKLLLLPAVFLLQFFSAAAEPPGKTSSVSAAVQYIGTDNGQLVFCVNFERETNAARRSTVISVTANGDQEIYENHYRESKMQVKFRVEMQDIRSLSFVISNGTEKIITSFDINLEVQQQINVVRVK